MPEYRRIRIKGGTYFFTVVTFSRKPIFSNAVARNLLRQAWKNVSKRMPFTTEAVCLLPDHIHCIWTLPEGDADYSIRWREIKRRFTRAYLVTVGPGGQRNLSRQKRGEVAIWQRRFWEHTIFDQTDLNQHIDYIHFNPVSHGLVDSVYQWQWSSFHGFVRQGYYEHDWGAACEMELKGMGCGE